jgi:4-hydroxyacetophenone monooxygenase
MAAESRVDAADAAEEAPAAEELWDALQVANLPTLLMVLAQLTGDRRWLEPPYAPVRTRGMDDNDSGGFPEPIQDEIRRAAFGLLRDGGPVRPTGPAAALSPDLLAQMISVSMGEEVPAEYGVMMLEEMGVLPRQPDWESRPDKEQLAAFQVLVIGAGVSGICAAIALHQAGIPVTVVEKSASIGGTWLDNVYPGCGVDTPSHLYSFSFAPHNWSRYFAQQEEILDYLEECVDKFGIRDHIVLDTKVIRATFDASADRWTVEMQGQDGRTISESVNAVISAVGQLNEPAEPDIPGADAFHGPVLHSARWPAGLDVANRRVAVVGTGASAMQIVPGIVDTAAEVTVFQRSPQWAVPSTNYTRDVPAGVRYLMGKVPLYAAWYRCRLVWSYSDKVHESLQVDPDWQGGGRSINRANDGHRRYFTRYLTEQLGDRTDLIPKLLPTYPPFAKRMLIDNNWFKTMVKDNVRLIDAGIERITPDGVIDTAGRAHSADVIVYATGFQTLRMIGSYEVTGRDGSLREEWGEDDARAYLGITIPGFPNFFCLYGPNTGLGHGGSLIFLTECATRYIVKLIQYMILHQVDGIEVKRDVFDQYNHRVDEAHENMIWSLPVTNNWYRNSRGRVVTNSPWRVVDYWSMTHDPDPAEFRLERLPQIPMTDSHSDPDAGIESGRTRP